MHTQNALPQSQQRSICRHYKTSNIEVTCSRICSGRIPDVAKSWKSKWHFPELVDRLIFIFCKPVIMNQTFSRFGQYAHVHTLHHVERHHCISLIRLTSKCSKSATRWTPTHVLQQIWGVKTQFFTFSPKDRFPDFASVDQSPPALRKFGKFPNIATLEASTWRVPNLAKRHLCTRCNKFICFSKQQPQQQQIRQRHATGFINKEQDTATNNKTKQQWAFGQMDTQTKKIHLHSCGGRAICNTWACGTPNAPLLSDNGEIRACFQSSWSSIDILQSHLSVICQSCFSDYNIQRFHKASLGLIAIPSYYEARALAFEDVSSDGDSGLSTYSS